MTRLLISHKDREQAVELSRRLADTFLPLAEREGCRWQGPQNPPMEFQSDLFRIELILFGPGPVHVQRSLASLRREPIFDQLARWLTVDVDPVNLR
jgi:primosomal protein N'